MKNNNSEFPHLNESTEWIFNKFTEIYVTGMETARKELTEMCANQTSLEISQDKPAIENSTQKLAAS